MSKPRLAFFAPSVGSGMAPLILATCQALCDQYDVTLFVPAHFPYADRLLHIVPLPSFQNKYARLLGMINPAAHWRIFRAMQNIKPDLVHIFNSEGYPWSISLALWCKSKNIPLIVTIHDPKAHPGSILAALNEMLGAITIRSAKLIHIFYDKFASSVRDRYRRPVQTVDYVPISNFYLVHRVPGILRERMALQFGRLERYKGIDTLVQAAALLPPDLKVVIAGPGTLDEDVRAAIAAQSDRFEIHERFLSDAEVATLFQRAKAITLPYREVTQSQLHAIAAEFGVVTVANDIGFFHDDVPRFGGILVKPDDPRALAAGIVQAMDAEPRLPADHDMKSITDAYDKMYRIAMNT